MARPPRPAVERFLSKVEITPSCWIWMAQKVRGYGQFRGERSMMRAHRFSYELFVGPIADGMTIDHLCRNPSCVNPEHLEPVSMRENTLRGFGPSAQNARKTHCIHGHALTDKNLILHKDGRRQCHQCRLILERTYRARRSVGQ